MLTVASGLLMLLLPFAYWATRPATQRPTRPWQVLYREQGKPGASPRMADRWFLLAWVTVAVGAVLRGAGIL